MKTRISAPALEAKKLDKGPQDLPKLGRAATERPNLVLTVREAASLLGISVPTFWRRVADKTIPKPIKLGGATRWVKSEILAVIDAAMAARD